MGLLSIISNIFKPAAKLIDDIHVSDEERGKLQVEFAAIQAEVNTKYLELEQAKLDAMSKIQIAESGSVHWITATWRPLCSVLFVLIIVLASFGVIKAPDENFYNLAQVFLGAYTLSRGAEKTVGDLFKKIGKK